MRFWIIGLLLTAACSRAAALTIVLDFNDPGQDNTVDATSSHYQVSTFDITEYGFSAPDDRPLIYNSILDAVRHDYFGIPTVSQDAASPLPEGHVLNVNFEIGDYGTAPANGDSHFYYVQIGTLVSPQPSGGLLLGVALLNSAVSGFYGSGAILGSVFTDQINQLSDELDLADLDKTTHAITGTLSHEIGHMLSLLHVKVASAVTPNGLKPLMATGTAASGLSIEDRLVDREFAWSATLSDRQGNRKQYSVQQLYDVLGSIEEPDVVFLTGDANNDGIVDHLDLIAVEKNFGAVGPADGLLLGDANDDGRVDGRDLLAVERNFGTMLPQDVHMDIQILPEPVTVMLWMLGGLWIAPYRSARRR